MRSNRQLRPRTDDQILSFEPDLELLAAVAAGRVIRADNDGEPGSSSVGAPHLLDGAQVRMSLRRLVIDELIAMPISGPPRLEPRGNQILEHYSPF